MIPAEVRPLIALLTVATGGVSGFSLHKLRQQLAANTESLRHNTTPSKLYATLE